MRRTVKATIGTAVVAGALATGGGAGFAWSTNPSTTTPLPGDTGSVLGMSWTESDFDGETAGDGQVANLSIDMTDPTEVGSAPAPSRPATAPAAAVAAGDDESDEIDVDDDDRADKAPRPASPGMPAVAHDERAEHGGDSNSEHHD